MLLLRSIHATILAIIMRTNKNKREAPPLFHSIAERKIYYAAQRVPDKMELKLHERIDKLTRQELEDIAEPAVQEAERRIKQRAIKSEESKTAEFTGYYKNGTSQFYGMKYIDSVDDSILFRIKGGSHSLVDMPMEFGERRKFMLGMAKIMGFSYCRTQRGNYKIYLPASNRKTSRGCCSRPRITNSKPVYI